MSFTIPIWVLVVLGIPVVLFAAFCMFLGFQLLRNFKWK
ncbi:hypothetical protein PH505_bb00180 [Pseudoalteromonas distincta]|nr:hypothetical protein PH505_bb00180 [Pseudoalteromonas distincta]